MDNALVSVIIPSFKASDNLIRAVESIFNQTYSNVEVIVVDDNNPDSPYRESTKKMIETLKTKGEINYIEHDKNKNGSAARNTGIRAAKGEYICFLDDDDEYAPTKIEKSVEMLEAHKEYDAVYSNVYMLMNGKITIEFKANYSGKCWKELLLDEGMLGTGSNIFVRRSVIEEVGFFDESFARYQDVEYMLRVLSNHMMYAIDEYLVSKNLSDRNVPNYKKSRANNELIYNKFAYLINELEENERIEFYSNQFGKLLHIAIEQKSSKEDILKAKEEVEKYRDLRLIEKMGCKCPMIYIIARDMYHFACKLFHKSNRR